ncbi:MAG: DUF4401 domain-containing protein [Pirellulaceae bacterium]
MSHLINDKPLMATDLIAYLQGKYQVDEAAALAVAEDRLSYNSFPLYLRILIGVGAVVSGGLLLIFLGIAGLFDEASNLLVLGFAMLGVAIYVHLRSRDRDQSKVSFVAEQQLSFLGVFTGKILIVTGAAMRDQAVGVFICALAFTLLTYWVYDMYLDRLASCAGTLVSGLILLNDKFNWDFDNEIGILIHLLVPLGLAIYLHPRIKQTYNPLAIALVGVAAAFSLGAMVDGSLGMLAKEVWEHEVSLAGLLTVMITCCSLIGLVVWACGGKSSLNSRYVIATIALTLLLGLASLTSTMIGLIVIILGYVCHDRLITLVGALFLPATLWLAIHSLKMGLMTTGLVLVAASLVLLAGYFLFRYWSFGDRPEDGSPEIAGEGIPHA